MPEDKSQLTPLEEEINKTGQIRRLDMSGKTYPPLIEEFQVGFEFEAYHSKDWFFAETGTKWIKKQWNVYEAWSGHFSLANIESAIQKGWIRVKYLDREDIESFEFHFQSEDKHDYEADHNAYFDLDRYEQYFADNDGNELFFTTAQFNEPPRIMINNTEYSIKNKSQLKQILQWTGILK